MLDLDDFIVVGFWIECGQPLLIGCILVILKEVWIALFDCEKNNNNNEGIELIVIVIMIASSGHAWFSSHAWH